MCKYFRLGLGIILLLLISLPSPGRDLLLKNGTVLPVTRGTLNHCDILILNGIIAKIGPNIEPPEGIKVVDASGKYIIPGIIDSHTHIALTGTNESSEPITPEIDMRDVLNADDPSIYTALTGGVTMVHTMHGSANPIGGENIVLKLKWGKSSEEMIVHEAFRTLKFALGENPKQANRMVMGEQRYPQSRMGVIAIIRREFLKAKDYLKDWERYNRLKTSKKFSSNIIPPRKDLGMEQLADMLRGKMLARCHTYRADETLEFLALSKEIGFKIACFEHVSEAFKIAKELAEDKIGISIFADSWAYKMEASEGIAYNAAFCIQKGVLVSINSDSWERIRRLFNEAAKSMKYGGLSENECLKLITYNPAVQLGVDKIVGSLEEGKHGDIAVFNEHPMSAYTRCDMTIIEGDIYFDRNEYLKEREEKTATKDKEKKDKGDTNED
ncbi:MAG: amidohydrolase family protein [Candidatus Aminicenantes bacterium]|nr:amidohydrolase family protein [Candidatus Aminicenantes bacterium]